MLFISKQYVIVTYNNECIAIWAVIVFDISV